MINREDGERRKRDTDMLVICAFLQTCAQNEKNDIRYAGDSIEFDVEDEDLTSCQPYEITHR